MIVMMLMKMKIMTMEIMIAMVLVISDLDQCWFSPIGTAILLFLNKSLTSLSTSLDH